LGKLETARTTSVSLKGKEPNAPPKKRGEEVKKEKKGAASSEGKRKKTVLPFQGGGKRETHGPIKYDGTGTRVLAARPRKGEREWLEQKKRGTLQRRQKKKENLSPLAVLPRIRKEKRKTLESKGNGNFSLLRKGGKEKPGLDPGFGGEKGRGRRYVEKKEEKYYSLLSGKKKESIYLLLIARKKKRKNDQRGKRENPAKGRGGGGNLLRKKKEGKRSKPKKRDLRNPPYHP